MSKVHGNDWVGKVRHCIGGQTVRTGWVMAGRDTASERVIDVDNALVKRVRHGRGNGLLQCLDGHGVKMWCAVRGQGTATLGG